MKGKIIALLVGACCSFSALAQTNTNDDWKLVWNDEFDGTGPLVIERWKAESGFVRNEEYQWYQQQNAYRQEGVLVLEGRAGIGKPTARLPAIPLPASTHAATFLSVMAGWR